LLEDFGNLLECHVASVMPECVIDLFEVIDIQCQYRVRLLSLLQYIEQLIHGPAIGQAGQRVTLCLVAEPAKLLLQQLYARQHGLADGRGIVVPGVDTLQLLWGLRCR